MPAQARKTPVKKAVPSKPTPAEAAQAEALRDGDVILTFRSGEFVIKRETRSDFRVGMAVSSGLFYQAMSDLLPAPADKIRLLSLVEPGEQPLDVINEFFAALAEASGEGNSSTS